MRPASGLAFAIAVMVAACGSSGNREDVDGYRRYVRARSAAFSEAGFQRLLTTGRHVCGENKTALQFFYAQSSDQGNAAGARAMVRFLCPKRLGDLTP